MKHIKTLIFVAISLFLTAMSCEKYPDGLPPETAEGKNTFGCLVNNEIFTDGPNATPFGQPNLIAIYTRSTDSLTISAYRRKNDKIESVRLSIANPVEVLPVKIDNATYNTGCYNCPCPYFIGKNTGNVILTRFDTVDKIVSGIFSFDGICSDNDSNSIVRVTEGRFDLKWMRIYE